jgi:hypothetical protein
MSADEIVDQAFAPVTDAIEKEHSSAKSAAEGGVKAAKQKALDALTA